MSKQTPLYDVHVARGASFTDFAGYQMPLKYTSELVEHKAVRAGAGMFDLSHMGEISVNGPQAAAFLNYALTGNLAKVKHWGARYTMITDEAGMVMDDLIVYRFSDNDFMIVANASNVEVVVEALAARATQYDVTLHDASATTALLAVQGPKALSIINTLTTDAELQQQITDLKYYACLQAELAGMRVLLARTGYTGEDGFELFVDAPNAVKLWETIEAAGAAHELVLCGLACRDSLRLEAGMPLYGNELTRETNPFAAGLGGVVRFEKEGEFIARDALTVASEVPQARVRVGLELASRRSARTGYQVFTGAETTGAEGAAVASDTECGVVTSGAPSPTLGKSIAMAYVDVALATPGNRVDVDVRGKREAATIVELPFYRRTA